MKILNSYWYITHHLIFINLLCWTPFCLLWNITVMLNVNITFVMWHGTWPIYKAQSKASDHTWKYVSNFNCCFISFSWMILVDFQHVYNKTNNCWSFVQQLKLFSPRKWFVMFIRHQTRQITGHICSRYQTLKSNYTSQLVSDVCCEWREIGTNNGVVYLYLKLSQTGGRILGICWEVLWHDDVTQHHFLR